MRRLWGRVLARPEQFRHGVLWTFVLLFVGACTSSVLTFEQRRSHAEGLAKASGWEDIQIEAGSFLIQSFVAPDIDQSQVLTVYIEGDGLAWVTPTRASSDPTPVNPLALQLALRHSDGNAAYLGRPCQYIDAQHLGCRQQYWTSARFAPEVIEAENFALDQLKRLTAARDIVLVGYSGGGAIAALLAARRNDVSEVITVAGNLGQRAWTSYHKIAPLDGSLDASDVAAKLTGIRQTHFIGGKDEVIPQELTRAWPEEFRGIESSNLIILPEFNHQCCWAQNWPHLLRGR